MKAYRVRFILNIHDDGDDILYLGLIGSLHLSFLSKIGEVLMTRHINKLFDIGVVDQEAKLVEFKLNLIKNLFLELFGAFENVFHGHGGCKNTSLTLDNALNEFSDMVGMLLMWGNKLGVEDEGSLIVDFRADCEDCREDKRQLLG